jgi:polysaccharide pyruvyl transferase CsaB
MANAARPYRIGISGSYGGMNLGDEAILEAMLHDLRAELKNPDILVFSRNPEDTRQRHGVEALPVREMHKDEIAEQLKQLDLFILGGGGILFEGLAEEFLREAKWAKEAGALVMTYAIGVGPITRSETKQLIVETLAKVDRIVVRENESKKLLTDIGVDNPIEVTADPALLLQMKEISKERLEQEGFKASKKMPVVGFSVREPGKAAPDLNVDQYHEVLANAADFMTERFGAHIVFIPMERRGHKDLQHSHAVIAKMTNAGSAEVLRAEFSSSEILGLMQHMNFAVGMRLHFLIFAAIQGVPFVPLPYASKIGGLLSALGIPIPPLKEINSGRLCAYLDYFWDTRQLLRKRLVRKLPKLQETARRNIEIVKELLEERGQ